MIQVRTVLDVEQVSTRIGMEFAPVPGLSHIVGEALHRPVGDGLVIGAVEESDRG